MLRSIQRFSLCPHCAKSYRLTSTSKQTQWLLQLQYDSNHSHSWCKELCGTHWTQWDKKPEHNLNSVLPYSKSIITPTSTTWHGTHLLWWWTLAAISVWGTEILRGHSNRHLAYPPQTDVDRLIEASTTNSLPVQHISSSKPRGVTTLTQYIDDEGRSQACGHCDHASQPLECACITQPQGPTEEFSDTLSLTREQTTPHTGA